MTGTIHGGRTVLTKAPLLDFYSVVVSSVDQTHFMGVRMKALYKNLSGEKPSKMENSKDN